MPGNNTLSTRPKSETDIHKEHRPQEHYADVARVACVRLRNMRITKLADCGELYYSGVYDIMLGGEINGEDYIEAQYMSYHMCLKRTMPIVNPHSGIVTRHLHFRHDMPMSYNIREALLYYADHDVSHVFNIIQNDKSIHLLSNFTAKQTASQYHDILHYIDTLHNHPQSIAHSTHNVSRHIHVYIGYNCHTYCTHIDNGLQMKGIDFACASDTNNIRVASLPQIAQTNTQISMLQILLLSIAPAMAALSFVCTYIFGPSNTHRHRQ